MNFNDNNITIIKSTQINQNTRQQLYYKSLNAPIDDMWELGIIAKGEYYEILSDISMGYLVTDENNHLIQFVVDDNFKNKGLDIFLICIKQLNIKAAYASTYEKIYFGMCMDFSQEHHLEARLYRDNKNVNIPSPLPLLKETPASLTDLKEVVTYTLSSMEASESWLNNYYTQLIHQKGLFLYWLNDEIVGTGEIRTNGSATGYGNIGMTVSTKHRQKGLGSYILNQMKHKVYSYDLLPICGTSFDNIASQKAIIKAGFLCVDRVYKLILQ